MTDLFDQTQDHLQNIDPTKDYMQELVGEGKKFKTPQDLARGKAEADFTIEVMKRRMDELREDYNKMREEYHARENLQEVLDRLTSQQNLASSEHTPANEDNRVEPAFKPEDIERLITQKLQEKSQRDIEEKNARDVRQRLIERHGNNYQGILDQQAENLGLDKAFVNQLARTNPQVFYKTFDLTEQRRDGYQAPPRSTQNQFAPSTGPKRTWTYYEKLRKENPKDYFSKKIQNQMIEDMRTLGQEFRDGDFRSID